MPFSREKKKSIVTTIREDLADAGSVVFVNFHGLSVNETATIRHALRHDGVSYRVVKKTLLRRALSSNAPDGNAPELTGEIAMVYGKDPLVPARSINAFTRRYKESLVIVGGIWEKTFRSARDMVAIGNIPPRDVLYAQVANLIHSPIQRLAVVVNEIARVRD